MVLKANSEIKLGDSQTYGTASISSEHFHTFRNSGGFEFTAGEAIAQGDAVVVKYDGVNTEARVYKAANDAAADNERVIYGLAGHAASAGASVKVASVAGTLVATKLTGLGTADTGAPLFLDTAGGLTKTAPTASGTSVFRAGYVANHNAGPGGAAIMLLAPQFIAKRP